MAGPRDSSLGEPIGFLLGAAARKVAKAYAAALAGGPMTTSQYHLLRRLWHEDGLQLRDLAERSQLDATSTTWLVDQLEKAKLIERRRTDADRRVVRLWLTADGRALRHVVESRITRVDDAIDAELRSWHTSPEVESLRTVLGSLIETLPEGEDLWAEQSDSWDRALARLQGWAEGEE